MAYYTVLYVLCSVSGKRLFNICLVYTITKSLLTDKNVTNNLINTLLKVYIQINQSNSVSDPYHFDRDDGSGS